VPSFGSPGFSSSEAGIRAPSSIAPENQEIEIGVNMNSPIIGGTTTVPSNVGTPHGDLANFLSPGFSPTEVMVGAPSGVLANQAAESGADTKSPSIGWVAPSPSRVGATFVPFHLGSQGNAPSGRAPAVCDDFDERPFFIGEGREKRDCGWLRQTSEERRTRLCQEIETVFVTCEETCSNCEDTCDDIEHVLFKIPNVDPWELTDCAWLRARPSLGGRVCSEGSPAFYLCKETCNICGEESTIDRKSPDDQRNQDEAATVSSLDQAHDLLLLDRKRSGRKSGHLSLLDLDLVPNEYESDTSDGL